MPLYEFHEEKSIKLDSLARCAFQSLCNRKQTTRNGRLTLFPPPTLHRIAGKLKSAFEDSQHNEIEFFIDEFYVNQFDTKKRGMKEFSSIALF